MKHAVKRSHFVENRGMPPKCDLGAREVFA
jgi:hypothetical protein